MRKNKKVAVVGLGYVGLPLAVLACEKGWQVYGLDIDKKKVVAINKGEVPFNDKELQKSLKKNRIAAGTDPAVLREVEVVIIAVPTPVTKENQPDLSPVKSALDSIKPHVHKGQVVVIESTINPGVMDEVVAPMLAETGVELVHCPERINPGDSKWSVRNIPRVLGAYSKTGQKKAVEFYQDVLEAPIKIMGSPTEAEAVKILENTFRDINIAFINEMARSFAVLGIDITNVIEGAATKPFSFMPHYPGNGVGGHCISVDPYYMIERAKQVGFTHHFLKLARKINENMPVYTVELLEKAAIKLKIDKKRGQVALLGLAYKKNVADTRNSPAYKILRELKKHGWKVEVFDPYVKSGSTVDKVDEAVTGAKIVMLACDHDLLVKKLTAQYLKQKKVRLVVDGRNALNMEKILKTGILYQGIGRSG